MPKTKKAQGEMTYEQALQELESILAELEGESRGLDDTMALFERGRALIRYCQDLLDKAELKVRTLGENDKIAEIEE